MAPITPIGFSDPEHAREPVVDLNGLSSAEAAQRAAQGLANKTNISTDTSVKDIVRSNILTYFNFIFMILTALLCIVGSFRNLTFLPLIIGNTLIGIIQELRAKKTLDKMNLLNAPHAIVIRDGKERRVLSEELVKGDLILLSAGDQICADAIVVKGNVSVNESLLTGESDEIEKKYGSSLMSGSFVVSGQCYARLEKVGDDSYISRLTLEAKEMESGEQSEMIRSINQIIKIVGIVIIPIALILVYQSYFVNNESFRKSITSMVAAVLGMIPEGLYLLTTVALALSTMRLAKRKVLLHDMKSIETLARVDTLCVDKTGTITEPDMCVKKIVVCGGFRRNEPETDIEDETDAISSKEVNRLLTDYVRASQDNNATMTALQRYIEKHSKKSRSKKEPLDILPFSSSKKYGGIVFDTGAYLLGAPEFIMRYEFNRIAGELEPYTSKGYRILLFARYTGNNIKGELTGKAIPLAYVVLSNPIRKNARETFRYFKSQDVTVKVISGDNPATVSEIALQAGIENAEFYVDAGTLDSDRKLAAAAEKYTVFGRVTPKQKQKLVQAMQNAGHTVAMTGDGVNDILAMKDADCSVAMASGSEAAAQVAQVVLLDSDFAHMPNVVEEGRCVVNNIQRSASLFLVKNIFSLLMAVFSAIFMFTYPLEPAQISLISAFTIGIPGFLLALEPNKERIQGNFLKNVLLKAFPAGLTDLFAVGSLVVCGDVFALPSADIATAATLLLAVVGFMILIRISHPFNWIKYGILAFNILGLIGCGFFLKKLFAMNAMSSIVILLLIVFAFASATLFRFLSVIAEKLTALQERSQNRKTLKKKSRPPA